MVIFLFLLFNWYNSRSLVNKLSESTIGKDVFETFDGKPIVPKDTPIIYNFNTEWCGFSQRFQPIWDNFTNLMSSKNIKVLDVKCDDPNNQQLCKQFNVPGYPFVVLNIDGDLYEYKGPRQVDALVKFVNQMVQV